VPTIRLDTFCERERIARVGVLKLDIEGAELLALQGAADLLAAGRIDAVIAEVRVRADYETQPLLQDLLAYLGALDYHLYNLYPFARSEIGQACHADAVWLGPRFRSELVERRGAAACGFSA
jgi:hypothetical protein